MNPGQGAGGGRRSPTRIEEERLFRQGYRQIAGIDEVGRGPLAGPVVAAAVILPPADSRDWYAQIRDSKTLSARQRERLAPCIAQDALAVGVGAAEVWEIEALGIVPATHTAMLRAIASLEVRPDYLLLDALPLPQAQIPFRALVRGDAQCLPIAAASIVAKVARDTTMGHWNAAYPDYGFARHKGYGTKEHLAQLRRLGPCPLHRRTFAPVRALVQGSTASHPPLAQRRGRLGERVAAAFLEARGYRLLERNARSPWGEIDLVAEQGQTLVFVEVRARSSDGMGTPWESITLRKQRRLVLAAQDYLERHGLIQREWRIDAVAVHLERGGLVRSVECLENAVQGF